MQKDYAKALRFLKQALRLEPENVSFMNSLAICYRDAKQYDDAIDTYNQILKRENDNHQVLFNKSLVLLLVQKNEEAAKIFRRCLKIRPDFQRARDKLKEMGVPEDED
jgi:tetratricopeptide (TPR) repeat protein